MDYKIHFGQKINELRLEKKLTKEKFSEIIGYSAANLTKIVRKEDIGTDVLKKICEAFDLDMSYFFDGGLITQKGKANLAGAGNLQYKGSKNHIGASDNQLELILKENEHLKEQIELLREMIDILKAK